MNFLEKAQTSVMDFFAPRHGRMRPTKGDFGIEIECEGTGNFVIDAPPGWLVHTDNSLRGPGGTGPGGVEYITNGAVKYEDVVGQVTRLRDAIAQAGGVLRLDSPRTSTHVHVNMQNEKMIDVIGILVTFAAVEPLFLHMCGPYRDGNSFCQPSFDSGDLGGWVHEMGRLLTRNNPHDYDFPQRGKYASMGMYRIHDLGTLECRTFPCSMDPTTVATWCRWLLNLRNYVKGQDDKSFRQTVKLGLHDPMAPCAAIFGEVPESRYLAGELIEYGCQEAYELTRILKHWINKKPEEKPTKKAKAPPGLTIPAFPNEPQTLTRMMERARRNRIVEGI